MSTFFGPVTTSCRRYLPQIHSRYYAIGLAPIYFLFFIFPPFFSMPFAFLTIFRSRVCAFLFSFFVVSNRIPGWRFLKVFKRRCFPPHIRAGVPTRLAGRAACGAPFAHRLTKLFSVYLLAPYKLLYLPRGVSAIAIKAPFRKLSGV